MVHVTEKNISMIDVDLLITECIRANRGNLAFAYLISPFISDFKIPDALIKFASNIITISDIERIGDLIGMLVHYGGEVNIVTRSPIDLEKTSISSGFVRKQARLLKKLKNRGCNIKINSKLHAKATVTSQGAVSGSFNLTASGRFFNLEEGNFFPNSTGETKKLYQDKLSWAEALFNSHSRLIVESDLTKYV